MTRNSANSGICLLPLFLAGLTLASTSCSQQPEVNSGEDTAPKDRELEKAPVRPAERTKKEAHYFIADMRGLVRATCACDDTACLEQVEERAKELGHKYKSAGDRPLTHKETQEIQQLAKEMVECAMAIEKQVPP